MINRKCRERTGSLFVALVLILQMCMLPIYAMEEMDHTAGDTTVHQQAQNEVVEEEGTVEVPLEEDHSAGEATPDCQPDADTSAGEDHSPDGEQAQPEDEILPNPEEPEQDEVLDPQADSTAGVPQNRELVWAAGVTPPQFEAVTERTKDDVYTVYKAVFEPGNGWYDLNKRYAGNDTYLCFAVAASNALHWWMEQNKAEITTFIAQEPNNAKRQELEQLRTPPVNQRDSVVYDRFLKQFESKPDGYWPDILMDQFLNGYRPKENEGTNDKLEQEQLWQTGPTHKTIGYFYDIFGTIRLSDRRHYDGNYERFGRDVKEFLSSEKIVLLVYSTGTNTHVVTLWGAEYDEHGRLKAVYVTDSDDPDDKNSAGVPYAMIRLNVKLNPQGLAIVSSNPTGPSGSIVTSVQTLELGKPFWEKRFSERPDDAPIPLQLKWGKTTVPYDGKPHAPTVEAANKQPYDDFGIFFEEQPVNAGTYTPKVVLKGISAHRYTVDPESLKPFTITPVDPKVSLTLESGAGQDQKVVAFEIRATGINGQPLDGTLRLETGTFDVVGDQIELKNGYARYVCDAIPSGFHRITATFTPSKEGVSQNYKTKTSQPVSVTIPEKTDQTIHITEIPPKTFHPENPETFELQVTGGQGSGAVTYTCEPQNVLSIQGSTATVIGAGTVTITAVKAADAVYNQATASYTMTVKKAQAPEIVFPQASPLVYGQKLSESTWIGGSTQYGSFVWEQDLVPPVGSHTYTVRFTPSPESNNNYESIEPKTGTVQVTVQKAAPAVTLEHEVTGKGDACSVTFSASVSKVGEGNAPTGEVTLVNQETHSEIAAPISLVDGVAAFTWSGMPAQRYQILAVYSGDENYNQASSQVITVDLREDQGGGDGGGDHGGSSGGGGSHGGTGGGSNNKPVTRPEVEKHPDGSTTETVTKPDGTVVIVIKKPDGSTSTTTTQTNGKSEIQVNLSKPAIEEAEKRGESVVLPMPEITASPNAEKAPVVHVTTGREEAVTVSMPVKELSYGTVAVVVNKDGSKEVIRKSAISDEGLVFSVTGQVTVEIVDRSSIFVDTKAHWGKNAIDFVTSRELYSGTSKTTFSPDAGMTRGMLVQVLYNLENNPKNSSEQNFSDVAADNWCRDAVQWAAENGIVAGYGNNQFAPENNVTREALAVILYRYAGSPAQTGSQLAFRDMDQVSDYASEAISWAVENGIMNGTTEHSLNPKGTATRAQVATMLMQFLNQTMS